MTNEQARKIAEAAVEVWRLRSEIYRLPRCRNLDEDDDPPCTLLLSNGEIGACELCEACERKMNLRRQRDAASSRLGHRIRAAVDPGAAT